MTPRWCAQRAAWIPTRTTTSSWSASTTIVSTVCSHALRVTAEKHMRVAAAVAVAATLCCGTDPAPKPTVALQPVASTVVPFSNQHDLAIVDETVLCVTNSYEARVRCLRPDGSLVGVFGRKGEGPGEFSSTPDLLRGPDGTLAAVSDNRLTLFRPNGHILSETTLPFGHLRPVALLEATVLAQHWGGGAEVTPVEISLPSGEVLWERPGLDSEVRVECEGGVSLGVSSPSGGWTFPACQRELVFFEQRDDRAPAIIVSPTYAEELPNERDVAEIESINSWAAFQYDVEAYSKAPKRNHLTIRPLAYDASGRLWVATQRDRRHHSYLDIFVGVEHIGTVRIQDRLMGYDLHGSTLVALVEREPNADGIAYRWADWYDIGGLEFTAQPGL